MRCQLRSKRIASTTRWPPSTLAIGSGVGQPYEVGGWEVLALAWSIGIALGSYLWARHLYTTKRSA